MTKFLRRFIRRDREPYTSFIQKMTDHSAFAVQQIQASRDEQERMQVEATGNYLADRLRGITDERNHDADFA